MRKFITAAIISSVAIAGFSGNISQKKVPRGRDAKSISVIERSHEGETVKMAKSPEFVKFKSAPGNGRLSAPAKETTEVPTEIVLPDQDIIDLAESWYVDGNNWYTGESIDHYAHVAIVDSYVYIKGLFYHPYMPEFNDMWVAGKIEDNKVVFPLFTYCGNLWGIYDLYFTHLNLTEDYVFQGFDCPVATYDPETKEITFTNDCSLNNGTEEGGYLTGGAIAAGTKLFAGSSLNSCETGEPVEIPYSNGFDSQEEFNQFGVIDANKDNTTWKMTGMSAGYDDGQEESADDWLISPSMYFEEGKSYSIKANACKSGPEHEIEIWLGTEPSIDAMTNMLLREPITAKFTMSGMNWQTLLADKVTVEKSGYYHVGIHIIGESEYLYLTRLDNFFVEELTGSPAAIEKLTIIPDAQGENEAALTFTIPSLMRDGSSIDPNSDVHIFVNDKEVLVDKPGKDVSYMVKVDKPGTYSFDVYAVLDGVKSPSASVTSYIGVDTPSPLTGFSIQAVPEGINFSWEAASQTGVNGQFTRPDEIKYNVWSVYDKSQGSGYYELDECLSGDISETEWIYNTGLVNTAEQGEYIYGVTAKNTTGTSDAVLNYVYYGKPYELPYVESFTNHEIKTKLMFSYVGKYDPALIYSNVNSDNDGTGLQIQTAETCLLGIKLGKISIENAENPYFIADIMSDVNATATFIATTPDNEEIELDAFMLAFDDFRREAISLEKVAAYPWIRIAIVFYMEEGGNIYVDNLNVRDLRSEDLAVSINATQTVVAGASSPIRVNVKNLGMNTVSDYKVQLYADNNLMKEWEGETLDLLEQSEFTYDYIPSLFDGAGSTHLKACIDYDLDKNPADNSAEIAMAITEPTKPTVSNLTAVVADDGVELSWTAAESVDNSIVEDFEDYDVQIVTDGQKLGEWTGWDRDRGYTAGFYNANWAWNNGEEYAFGLVDMPDMGLKSIHEANSGEKALMFMSVYIQDFEDPSQFYPMTADKWLISPEQSGEALDLSFFALPISNQYGEEVLEVLISETDMNVESFKHVETFYIGSEYSDEVYVPEWDEYHVKLPEGTKYFALRYVSSCVFGLFIDDIKYGTGLAEATGYNIYLDRELVEHVGKDVTSYKYTNPLTDTEHIFSVTADYAGQESMPQSVPLIPSRIEDLLRDGKTFNIYSIDGICVKTNATSLDGLNAGVYLIGNRKVIVK